MLITTDMIRAKHGCKGQTLTFEQLFPQGAEIPGPDWDTLNRAGLDGWWLLKQFKLSETFRVWNAKGTVIEEEHYDHGELQDLADGSAAVRRWNDDGTLIEEEHYDHGYIK